MATSSLNVDVHETLIAAVVVSYDLLNPLIRCIHSLAQSELVNEIWVVENGTDNQITKFLSAIEDGGGCGVIREGNLGWIQGVRAGVDASESPILLLLNDDHVLTPETLERGIEMLFSGYTAVGPEVAKFYGVSGAGIVASEDDWEFISGSGLMIRRSDFEKYGRFGEEFGFGYGEDVDFSCKVLNQGGKLGFVRGSDGDGHISTHNTVRATKDFDLFNEIDCNSRLILARWYRMGQLDHRAPNAVSPPQQAMAVAPRVFVSDGAIGRGLTRYGSSLLSALEGQGVELNSGADKALSCTLGRIWARDAWRDREEWLFTMTEHDVLPPQEVRGAKEADVLVVPSQHSKEVYKAHGITSPIHVVPLGVDTSIFVPGDHRWMGIVPFRFLFVGANTMRKGYDLVISSFYSQFGPPRNDAELYLKMSGVDGLEPGIHRIEDNVVLDNRDITDEEMRDIYYSAHCFVFPSRGEGWGLTLLEAMACGCLCIAPRITGMKDYINSDCALILETTKTGAKIGQFDLGEVDTPVPRDVCEKMAIVFRRYHSLLPIAKKGAEVARQFTWERSARDLTQLMFGGILA